MAKQEEWVIPRRRSPAVTGPKAAGSRNQGVLRQRCRKPAAGIARKRRHPRTPASLQKPTANGKTKAVRYLVVLLSRGLRRRGCEPLLGWKNSRNILGAALHAASVPVTGATTRSCSRFRSCWFQVIGQKTLHLLPRIKQARPHRADIAFHHLRNFLMRQPLHIVQHDDQSMVF